MNREAFRADSAGEHVAFQAGTLSSLMEGHFGGDATIGEVLEHGDLGIGTVQHLGGELVIVDGEAFVVDGNGVVSAVLPDTPTPFAVVCRFVPLGEVELAGPLGLGEVRDRLDAVVSEPLSVLAVRIDGEFADLGLRSVHAQQPPYPSLTEVTKHQTAWTVQSSHGTLVGFRFPDLAADLEVPGYHFHFISEDRTVGGHVLDLTLLSGHAAVDGGDDLHIELPADIGLGVPGVADRAAIRAAEGE